MTQAQKERVIEAVEMAANGMITRNELIMKLEAITNEKFEEHVS